MKTKKINIKINRSTQKFLKKVKINPIFSICLIIYFVIISFVNVISLGENIYEYIILSLIYMIVLIFIVIIIKIILKKF